MSVVMVKFALVCSYTILLQYLYMKIILKVTIIMNLFLFDIFVV